MESTKKGKKFQDKLMYDFIVKFHNEVLKEWAANERHLELPAGTSSDNTMYKSNIRALIRLLHTEEKVWVSCHSEEFTRFKRSSVGSTRNKNSTASSPSASQDSFAVWELSGLDDSGVNEEQSQVQNSLEIQKTKFEENVAKLVQVINGEEPSEKLIWLVSSLNAHFEADLATYSCEIEDESEDSIEEPAIKRLRELEITTKHLNSFMTRLPQRRMIGNPMQTLVLKLSTINNMSSRQIYSCFDIMQNEMNLWDNDIYEAGMTSDRLIRMITYRILPLHELFVKQFLKESEYLWVCTDGARIGLNCIL
jgi:mRNA-degrading endonuclease HigB of HigAB toxin-antitoxin module